MTVKRQHMVWRYYLKPWSNNQTSTNGKIFLFDKETGKIRNDNLNNVAVKGYAYDISGANEADKSVIRHYFLSWWQSNDIPPVDANLAPEYKNRDFLEKSYIGPIEGNGKGILDNLRIGKFPFDTTKNDIWQKMKLLSEEHSYDLAMEIQEEIVLPSQNDDPRFIFFEFFFNQFFRTEKQRRIIKESYEETKRKFPEIKETSETTKNLFPLLMFFHAHIAAVEACEKCYCVQLIANNTLIDFITCDCPIVIPRIDPRNNEKPAFYYPIDGRNAIRCRPAKGNSRVEIADPEEVDTLNRIVFEYAERQVFASTREELERYLPAK